MKTMQTAINMQAKRWVLRLNSLMATMAISTLYCKYRVIAVFQCGASVQAALGPAYGLPANCGRRSVSAALQRSAVGAGIG